jgi:hypothetical protein
MQDKHTNENSQLRADGGLPINKIFDKTGTNRVSDLDWGQDEDGRLYAITEQDERTVVRIDAKEGTIEEIGTEEMRDINLERISDSLAAGLGD